MSKKKKFGLLLFLFIIFVLWYYFIYLPRLEKQKLSEIIVPDSKQLHILWGYPACDNDKIFEYEGFVSGYDTLRLNPLWVSYNLKKEYLTGQKFLKERKFAPDPALDKKFTALDKDFVRTGYDRGHLARLADMKGRSKKCELESCYFTNISPQKQNFNRKTWNNLERAIDDLTIQFGESWIITGPYFDDDRQLLNKRVEIPDGFYKIVILNTPSGLYQIAFALDMDDSGKDIEQYQVSIDSIEILTKIDFFHELDDDIESDFEAKLLRVPYQWKK